MLKSLGLLALAGSALQACSSTAPASPTAAPGSSQPTAAPKSQAAPSGQKVTMHVAVWTDPVRTWMKKYALEWAKQHPEVDLKLDVISYGDMPQKQLTELATGTLQDLSFNGNKWYYFNIYKGAFLPIDSYVKEKDPGKADFIPVAWEAGHFEGKMYGLASEVNTGNQNIIIYNKTMVEQKGVKPPTSSWTQPEFLDFIVKMTDKSKGIFGTDYFPAGTYYDFGALLLGNGGQILEPFGKKFYFDSPISVAQTRWATEIRTKYHAAPSRAEAQGISFPAGKVAATATGVYAIVGLAKTIGDKFQWEAILGPTGENGRRGFDSFVLLWGIYSKSKVPDKAYDLMAYYTSEPVQKWSLINQSQPPTRKSLWDSPEANKISPVWGEALKWITDGVDKGPFPMPWNLRYTELEAKWENVGYSVFYGEVPLEDGIRKTQQECQAIVDLPRP